jgi:hypothetical protein
MKPATQYLFDGDKMHVVETNEVDGVFDYVKTMRDIHADGGTSSSGRYFGSLDPITAANFMKDSGLRIGTKEFAAYAKQRMKRDYQRFVA